MVTFTADVKKNIKASGWVNKVWGLYKGVNLKTNKGL